MKGHHRQCDCMHCREWAKAYETLGRIRFELLTGSRPRFEVQAIHELEDDACMRLKAMAKAAETSPDAPCLCPRCQVRKYRVKSTETPISAPESPQGQ